MNRMNWLYDSHIHLSDPVYQQDLESIIAAMQRLRIKACCVSMDNSNSDKTLEISRKSNLILPFIGIHPERAIDDLDSMILKIEKNIDYISGIGEIGLDPTYVKNNEDYQIQKMVFERLLNIAEKFKKPVSIHSRKSLKDIFEIMTSYDTSHSLLHWFDGSKKQLNKAMDMGFFVSYGPVMVYANDKQSLLSHTRLDKILIETDGPVRFSRCFEQKSGHIGFIPSVLFCASKVLKRSYYETSKLIENNSKAYLGI